MAVRSRAGNYGTLHPVLRDWIIPMVGSRYLCVIPVHAGLSVRLARD